MMRSAFVTVLERLNASCFKGLKGFENATSKLAGQQIGKRLALRRAETFQKNICGVFLRHAVCGGRGIPDTGANAIHSDMSLSSDACIYEGVDDLSVLLGLGHDGTFRREICNVV